MPTTVTYLFDPLCGWCYGASPAVNYLKQQVSVKFVLSPTGMFSGGERVMDSAFADYAWSNDQRIEKLTGQRFTAEYRNQVLGHRGGRFDSTAMTMALTAVSLTEPERELETLGVLQKARYVQGLDTCDASVVEHLLRHIKLLAAADRFVANDAVLVAANSARIKSSQVLMQRFGVQGVPALLISDDEGSRLVNGSALHDDFDKLLTSP